MKLCEIFWEEFLLVARVLYKSNHETEIADVFDFIREMNGGYPLSPEYLAKVDRQVQYEFERDELERQASVHGLA